MATTAEPIGETTAKTTAATDETTVATAEWDARTSAVA
jgi:hypothetical protein